MSIPEFVWETLESNPRVVSVAELTEAITEVMKDDTSGEDESGFWMTIVTAIYHNHDTASRTLLSTRANRAKFQELKDQYGPDDLELPEAPAAGAPSTGPAGAGGVGGKRRRRGKTARRRGGKRKATRRHHIHHRGA